MLQEKSFSLLPFVIDGSQDLLMLQTLQRVLQDGTAEQSWAVVTEQVASLTH